MTKPVDSLWRTARKLRRRTAGRKSPPALLFFTDPLRTPHPELALAGLPRGAGVVYRAFGAPDALAVGKTLSRLARRRGLVFMVGASAALAVALRADGLHLPERLAARAGENRRLGRRFIITAAAHGLPAALRAQRAGAAAIIVSAVFPSASPSAGPPIGARRLAALAARLSTPVYALGGVNAATARLLSRAHIKGIAAIGGVAGPNTGETPRPTCAVPESRASL